MATCRQSTTYSCNTVNRVILRAHQCTRSIAKMRGLYLSPLLLLGVLAFSGVAPPRCHASESHPFGIDDYLALRSAHAVALSRDGKTILFDVRVHGGKGPTKHEWRLIDISGANSRKLDLPQSFEPVGFTKEGALFGGYRMNRQNQLAVVPLNDGKPTLFFVLPNGMRTAAISPDGKQFALTVDSRAKDALEGIHNVAEPDESSLYVIRASDGNGAWWCPELKFVSDIVWSRDSARIAVISHTPKIGHHEMRSVVSVCSAQESRKVGEIRNATNGIAWSKDESEIIFSATISPTLTAEHVWTVPAAGGIPLDRTPQLDGTATDVKSDPLGTVWVEIHRGVLTEIDTFVAGNMASAFRWPAGAIEGLPVRSAFKNSSDVLAFSVGDPEHATNVAVNSGSELKKITFEGEDTLANVSRSVTKTVHWVSKEGTKLEGIVTFPPGYIGTKKYPFLVLPHGGPEVNDSPTFDAFPQFIAGMGYVVLQPQYRGSTGYGSRFMSAIYQHFGDRAYRDVESATDFAIAQGWADPKRLAIFGWSAGGYMAAWAITQTHRYKAAIDGGGVTDWLSFVPTSDTWQTDFDARLQEAGATPMLQFSPVMHADQVTTPLLILHGESDLRVPLSQAREFYVLLRERDKTVRMVTYPGSQHFPDLAEQRRDIFTELANWLAKYNP